MVVDREVTDAMARSFLGKLPVEVVDRLLAEGEQMPDLVILPAHDPSGAQRLLAS